MASGASRENRVETEDTVSLEYRCSSGGARHTCAGAWTPFPPQSPWVMEVSACLPQEPQHTQQVPGHSPSSVSLRSPHAREKATCEWGPLLSTNRSTVNQSGMLLSKKYKNPADCMPKHEVFSIPETRTEEPLLVLMLAMLGWCLCDIGDLFLMVASWLLFLYPPGPHAR